VADLDRWKLTRVPRQTKTWRASGRPGALRLFFEEVNINVKVRLIEVDFLFLAEPAGGGHGNRVTIQAGLHRRKLYLSFSIGGPADARETLPADLVDAIKQGLDYAKRHVRVQDLVEQDPEPECGEEQRE
jgi:hypothetical protein